MDLIFIDTELPKELSAKLFQEVYSVFGSYYKLEVFSVKNGFEAINILNKKKNIGYLGSFALVVSKKNLAKFSEEFPNNVIDTENSETEDELKKIVKQIVWMLNNFGREKKNMTDRTFVVSDTHFYHENIIKYCDRPYANMFEMNEDLIAKWNAAVGKDDIVWHLGDFCFGSKDHIKEIVPRLNGRINLVLGNHDHHKIAFYYECGFNRVYDHPVVISNFFILSHEPLQWVKDGDVYANIYGHVHQQKMYRDFTSNTFCACAERIGYAPIRWTEMIEKMKNTAEQK
jgi:calcineurin-like phosphoesterase family protein